MSSDWTTFFGGETPVFRSGTPSYLGVNRSYHCAIEFGNKFQCLAVFCNPPHGQIKSNPQIQVVKNSSGFGVPINLHLCPFGKNRGAGQRIYYHHLLQKRASFKPLYWSINRWKRTSMSMITSFLISILRKSILINQSVFWSILPSQRPSLYCSISQWK